MNGTFTFPGAGQPIMVKLADAKPQDMQRVGAKRGIDVMGGGECLACDVAVRFCFVFRGVVWVCMGRALLCMVIWVGEQDNQRVVAKRGIDVMGGGGCAGAQQHGLQHRCGCIVPLS